MTGTVETQTVDSSDLSDKNSTDCSETLDVSSCDSSDKVKSLNLTTADEFIDLEDHELIDQFRLVSRHTFIESCPIPELKELKQQILDNDYRVLQELKKYCPDDYQKLALDFGWTPQDDFEALKIVQNIIDALKKNCPKVVAKLTPLVAILEAEEGDDIPPVEHAADGLMWLRFNHPDYTIITAWLQRFLHVNYIPEIFEFPGDLPEEIVNEAFSETLDSELLKQLNLEEIFVDDEAVIEDIESDSITVI